MVILNITATGRRIKNTETGVGTIEGTLRAKVGWNTPWIIEGDSKDEIKAQEETLKALFPDFTFHTLTVTPE